MLGAILRNSDFESRSGEVGVFGGQVIDPRYIGVFAARFPNNLILALLLNRLALLCVLAAHSAGGITAAAVLGGRIVVKPLKKAQPSPNGNLATCPGGG